MEFDRNGMLEGLEQMKKFTAGNRSISITECCLYNPETMTLYGTDLDTGILIHLPYADDGTDEFDFCINVKQMIAILKGIKTEKIEIRYNPENVPQRNGQSVLYAQKMRLTINQNHHIIGEAPDDYPLIPELDEIEWAKGKMYPDWIRRTNLLCAKDDRRTHIRNVYYTSDAIMSTDGSRLHWLKTYVETPQPFFLNKGLAAKLACVGSARFGVQGAVEETHRFVVFAYPNMMIFHRIEFGEFPEVKDILGRSGGYTFKANRSEFEALAEKFSLLTSDKYKGIVFDIGGGVLKASYTNPDWGEVQDEEIGIRGDVSSVRIAANPDFVRDALKAVRGDTVEVSVMSKERPMLFYEPGMRDHFVAVVMPMRV